MNIEDRNARAKGFINMKGVLHIGMGGVYIALAIAVIYFKSFGAMPLSSLMAYTIGSVMLLYGGFRVWRGLMDMKQRRSH